MKKALSLILALSLLLSLCGCGQAGTDQTEPPVEAAAPSETAVPETTAAPTEETVPAGNRIIGNFNNAPFNAFGTRYAPSEITFIQFVDSHEAIAGISGNDASRNNDHSVFACVVEEGEEKILYLYGKGGIIAPVDCSRMFAEYTNVKNISFGNCFDTSRVTNMTGMFSNCEKLEALDLGCFDTSAVQDMSYMFSGCTSLQTVNVSSFETGNVLLMNFMFHGADQLTNVDIPKLDTGRVAEFKGFMTDGGTVNGQPWKQLFAAQDASTTQDPSVPLYGDMFFTVGGQELVESIITRLAADFDVFYELTLIKGGNNGQTYTLVPTAENTYDLFKLEIRPTPVEGGEDIQVISITSPQTAIKEDGTFGVSAIYDVYYALMGKNRQDTIDSPPKLTQVATSPTLIMESRVDGLVCDIAIFTDAVVAMIVPEGSIIE